MKMLFDPVGRMPLWGQRLLCLFPAAPLLWETDLTALLWLGSTAAILWLSRSARHAVFQMLYKSWPVTLAIGVLLGTLVGLIVNPAIDAFAEQVTGTTIDLSQFSEVKGDVGAYVELLLVAILFGGVVEELAFRAFFIGWGTRLFGMKAAIPMVLLSSLAFGIGHLYQDLAGGISTGLFSVLVGTLYLALDRKALPVILVHAVSNFWGVTDIFMHGT